MKEGGRKSRKAEDTECDSQSKSDVPSTGCCRRCDSNVGQAGISADCDADGDAGPWTVSPLVPKQRSLKNQCNHRT